AKAALLVDEAGAVLKHHDGRGLVLLVLCGDVSPPVARCAGEDLAGPGVFSDRAFGNAFATLRVRAEHVFFGDGRGNQCEHDEDGSHIETCYTKRRFSAALMKRGGEPYAQTSTPVSHYPHRPVSFWRRADGARRSRAAQ